MFCAKCGKYTESGPICNFCAAESEAFDGFSSRRRLSYSDSSSLKVASLLLALLAFFLQFSDLITEKKGNASEYEYEEYIDEVEDDEDYDDDYLETESFGIYADGDKDFGQVKDHLLNHAKAFFQWSFLGIALVVGLFFASMGKKYEGLFVVVQGVFFALMLLGFLYVWFSTFSGEAFYRDYNSSYSGYGINDDDIVYYYRGVGLSFTGFLGIAASIAGFVSTVISAKKFTGK